MPQPAASESQLANLAETLASWPGPQRYLVALSGGADSTALLHLMSQLLDEPATLTAIHINHHLQAGAGEFQRAAEQSCASLGVALRCIDVEVPETRVRELGPEAAAREARYQAFEQHLAADEVLLLAQHQQDQAETLLLNLMRGAGVLGLAAMPPRRPLGRGWLARPLLDWPRDALRDIASNCGLAFVEDPSNEDSRFDRNYLRRHALPQLAQRWPAVAERLGTSAELCREAAGLLDQLAELDAENCLDRTGPLAPAIHLEALATLGPDRQANLLRWQLKQQELPLPNQSRLTELLRQLEEAGNTRSPGLGWSGAQARCYRQQLFLDAESPVQQAANERIQDEAEWHCTDAGLAGRLEQRPRSGGESLRLRPDGHQQSLKDLFQSGALPPWLRDKVPLLYLDGQLVAVGDVWLEHQFSTMLQRSQAQLPWTPRDQRLARWRDAILAHAGQTQDKGET